MSATLAVSDFLLARIAEDEERLRYLVAYGNTPTWPPPDRLAAEREAKRQIVELRQTIDLEVRRIALDDFERATGLRATRFGLDAAIRSLAAAYADHPDYRGEWSA